MPKRKARKVSGDPILQDCNITSATYIDTEVSYPSDTTLEKSMESYDVLNQSPSCSQMHKLDEDFQVTDSSKVQFKIPFSTKNVRHYRPSLFDSVLDNSESNTLESSAVSEPFKRKFPDKEISFSISSSNDSINNNLSARREPKFVRKKITRSKTSVQDHIFDSDLDESVNKSKTPSCDANSSIQVRTRKSTIANYKGKRLAVNNSGIFESDLESSDMTNNISNLDSIAEDTSHENITTKKQDKTNSDLPKFLTKAKNRIGQDFANNTFDSIIFNESSNTITSECIPGHQSTLATRTLPSTELTNSVDDQTDNLSTCKLPSLPFVKTGNRPDEINEDIFQSDLEASDISSLNTTHTFAAETLVADDGPGSPRIIQGSIEDSINISSKSESTTSMIINEKEQGKELVGIEATTPHNNSRGSGTFIDKFQSKESKSKDEANIISNRSGDENHLIIEDLEAFRPNNSSLGSGTFIDQFQSRVSKSKEDNIISNRSENRNQVIIEDLEVTRPNNNSQASGTLIDQSQSKVSKSKDEVNISNRSENGNHVIVEDLEATRPNNNSGASETFIDQSQSKVSKSKDKVNIISNRSENGNQVIIEDLEATRPNNNSQASGTLIDQSQSKVSKSKDKVNITSNRSKNQNLGIIEETVNAASICSDILPLAYNIRADIIKSRKSAAKRVSFKTGDTNVCTIPASTTSKDGYIQLENNSNTSLSPLVYDNSLKDLNRDSVYIDMHPSRSRNSGSSVNSNSENNLVNSNNNGGSVVNEGTAENIQTTEHSNIDESESDYEEYSTTSNADIDGVGEGTKNEDNIEPDYVASDNNRTNVSDGDSEDSKENFPDDNDEEEINYSSNDRLADTSDESHSNVTSPLERSFEVGNQQSERYITGNPKHNHEDGEQNRPMHNLSKRKTSRQKRQGPDKLLSPLNRNVYEDYESFLRKVHDNENQFLRAAQTGRQPQTNMIVFKKPYPKKSSKSRIRNILDNLPYSELLKSRKRPASEANREQTLHNEIEESLRKRQKQQPIVTKLNNGKLKKPKKWVSTSLYEFIINKLKPRYGVNSRVQAEKLVVYLVGQVDKVLKIQDLSFYSVVEEMKLKLASLQVVQTHFDFRELIMNYFDGPFSLKVYPFCGDVSNPFEPENIFEVIPIGD